MFTPASRFLVELRDWRNQTGGSLEDIAYIIADWCNFLQSQGAQWNTASERHYIRWLQPLKAGASVGGRRRGRKAGVIWRWYRFLKPTLEDSGIASFADAITVRLDDGQERPRYKAAGSPRVKNGKRPIPSDRDVERVLSALAACEGLEGRRNWMIGEVVVKTGLRAMGVHGFTLDHLNEMLAVDGIVEQGVRVETLARDRLAKAGIRQRLLALKASGRSQLLTKVTEKRNKTREVGFPILLVLAILEHVWGTRASQLAQAKVNETTAKRHLWLGRNGKPLALGSLKNILAQGFRDAGLKGSGHSLRAAFLTSTAVELIRRAKAIHGDRFDFGGVVTELMEIAGHDSEDTLWHYIEEARLREALFDVADADASRSALRTEVGRSHGAADLH